jgi:hypothetical protein
MRRVTGNQNEGHNLSAPPLAAILNPLAFYPTLIRVIDSSDGGLTGSRSLRL